MTENGGARRFLLFLSIALQSAMLAFMAGRWIIPPAIALAALVGLFWPRPFRMDGRRGLLIAAPVALLFYLLARAARIENYPGSSDLFPYAYRYFICLFFLVIQATQLFRRFPDPRHIPFFILLIAIFVFVYGGNTMFAAERFSGPETRRVYRLLALAQTALLALLAAGAIRRRREWDDEKARPLRIATLALCVALVIGMGWTGGSAAALVGERAMRALENIRMTKTGGRSEAGFSRLSWLGSVAHWKAKRSDEVAMRVYSDYSPGYMRGSVFVRSDFRGGAWSSAAAVDSILPEDMPPESLVPADGGVNVFRIAPPQNDQAETTPTWRRFEVFQLIQADDTLFAPLHTEWLVARLDHLRLDTQRALMTPQLPADGRYLIYAPDRPPTPETPELRPDPCLQLPDRIDPRIVALAAQITSGCLTTPDKIRSVVAFFRANFTYRFGIAIPPDARHDPLRYFLLQRTPAHCEYFASGAVLLLRLAAVPSRFVTGFVVEERNPYGGYWLARNRDAHAWVEAWDDQRGWVTVEPTPPAGVPGRDDTPDHQALWRWDAWKQRFHKAWLFVRAGGLRRATARAMRLFSAWITSMPPSGYAVALALVAALVLFWRAVKRRRIAGPAFQNNVWRHILRRMDRRLARCQMRRAPSETPHRFAARIRRQPLQKIDAEQAARWYEAYARLRFGGADAPAARRELERLMPR